MPNLVVLYGQTVRAYVCTYVYPEKLSPRVPPVQDRSKSLKPSRAVHNDYGMGLSHAIFEINGDFCRKSHIFM